MINLTEFHLRQLVGNNFFTVTFLKKDGSVRTMNCRLGVEKHLKGGEMKHNPSELNHLIVYDMQSKGYRTVNVNTLIELKFNGKVINF